MMKKKPIEKYLGKKCIACRFFSHKEFVGIKSRLEYGQRNRGGYTFGHCEALNADDAVGSHLAKDEGDNPLCKFESAGDV